MRRVLVIDDNPPAFAGEIERDAQDDNGNSPELTHINPTSYFSGGATPDQIVSALLSEAARASAGYWDVIAIDLYLGEFGFPNPRNLSTNPSDLEVCLRVAEAVRDKNKCATVLLYSGTLAKYINDLLATGASDTQLRRIFHAGVANFVPRNRVGREVISAMDNPSWLLRVDRLLMKHADVLVSPEEAEFKGRRFADLAMAVRRQDHDGQRITHLAAEYGVSCFADLNS